MKIYLNIFANETSRKESLARYRFVITNRLALEAAHLSTMIIRTEIDVRVPFIPRYFRHSFRICTSAVEREYADNPIISNYPVKLSIIGETLRARGAQVSISPNYESELIARRANCPRYDNRFAQILRQIRLYLLLNSYLADIDCRAKTEQKLRFRKNLNGIHSYG